MSDVSGVGGNPYNQLNLADQAAGKAADKAADKAAEQAAESHKATAVEKGAENVRNKVKGVTVLAAEEIGVPDTLYDETDKNLGKVERGEAEAQERREEQVSDKTETRDVEQDKGTAVQDTAGFGEVVVQGETGEEGTIDRAEIDTAYRQNGEPQGEGEQVDNQSGKAEDVGPTEKTFSKKVDLKA